jgi:hypothetical protein
MKRIVWTFGLISGAVLSAMMALTVPFESSIGYDKALIIGYTTMVVSFLLIFFGIRSYRDNVGGGSVTFGRGLAVGVLIAVISSVCYVATWEVIYFKFMPDFLIRENAHALDKMKRSGASEAVIQQKSAEMKQLEERYNNLLFNSALTFLEPLPVGILIALISAGALRRKREEQRGIREARGGVPEAG